MQTEEEKREAARLRKQRQREKSRLVTHDMVERVTPDVTQGAGVTLLVTPETVTPDEDVTPRHTLDVTPDEPCNARGIPYSAYCTAEDLSRYEPLMRTTIGDACRYWRIVGCPRIALGDGDDCTDLPLMLAHGLATDDEKTAVGAWLKVKGYVK
jgi:hypothetical protein